MAYILKTNIAHKSNYGSKRNTDKIEYIVIHYTANDGDTDENNGKYFNGANRNASAHYFVDGDSITQSVPDNYIAWSVGGKKYSDCVNTGGGKCYGKCTNTNSLNIEICDDMKNGAIYPSADTITNAINFTKRKMKEYGIPKERVIRHFDVVGKKCPAYWVDDTKWKAEFWNHLGTDVKSDEIKQTNKSDELTVKVPFMIMVDKVEKGDVLNIRKEPNSTAAKSGELKYNDTHIYTITEVKNGWGRLKSGIGWINLTYTKKITGTTPEIKVGSLVKITGTKYYNGKTIPNWVKNQNWYVQSITGDKVIINENEKKTNKIGSPVKKSDLQFVK